ncbi:MAG: DsbA family protein [Emcibacter sp.]|nr:DsbA family protein [Emcibacter sp.]
MTKQLYKRISLFFALSVMAVFAVITGASAADQKSGFLNYDMVLGDKDAPIEIIEYASTTCPHCATFHKDTLPQLKKKYIDTGKVKLVFRNYVFSQPFDVFAASLNRCVSEKKFFPLLGLYFKRQPAWVKYKEFGELKRYGKYAALGFAKGEAIKIAKIAGMKETEAYQCLARPEVLKYLMDVNKHAVDTYEVNSTPTIIVNGKKLDDNRFEAIEKAILAESK